MSRMTLGKTNKQQQKKQLNNNDNNNKNTTKGLSIFLYKRFEIYSLSFSLIKICPNPGSPVTWTSKQV